MVAGERPAFMNSDPAVWPFRNDPHERGWRLATEPVFLTRPTPVATTRNVRETVCYQLRKRTALRSGRGQLPRA
jgi:hypothetical protein